MVGLFDSSNETFLSFFEFFVNKNLVKNQTRFLISKEFLFKNAIEVNFF